MHQSVANAMQRLQVELIIGLDRHEAHVLPRHRFGDCFGIEEVVLVRLEKRLYELRRDSRTSWPCSRSAAPMKCAPEQASMPTRACCIFAVYVSSCWRENFFLITTLLLPSRATRWKVLLPRSM